MMQTVADYLNKYTPPYMNISLHMHPADNSVHLKADLKVAVHWKHTDKTRFQQINMVKVGRVLNGAGPDDYRKLVDQMLDAYAKELAAGVVDGRQFNQFAFEGGTVQTLGAIPDPNTPDPLSYTPGTVWIQSTPKGNNSIYQAAMAAAGIAPSPNPGTIDLSGGADDLTVKTIRDVINDHHSAAIPTDTIRLSQEQLTNLMSDPYFPQATPDRLHPTELYGHTLEVVKL